MKREVNKYLSYIYDEKNIKSKEDAIIALEEIRAYQSLEGLPFDFGDGLIQNDLSYGTEHVYWKMDAQVLEDIIEDWEKDIEWANWSETQSKKKKHKNKRLNKHLRKIIGKRKLINLFKASWWIVYYNEKENRYIRCYYSGRKGFAKWCSDRAVRNRNDFSLIGAGYRKCFNYWNIVF